MTQPEFKKGDKAITVTGKQEIEILAEARKCSSFFCDEYHYQTTLGDIIESELTPIPERKSLQVKYNEYDCATVAVCVRDFPLMLPSHGLHGYEHDKQLREIDVNYLSIVMGMMVKPLQEQKPNLIVTCDSKKFNAEFERVLNSTQTKLGKTIYFPDGSSAKLVKEARPFEPPVFEYTYPPKPEFRKESHGTIRNTD